MTRQARADGERTRAKILDAAEAQFGAGGYDGVSLRDITEAAGVTLALASYHFGSKDELFEAVVARRAAEIAAAREARLAALSWPEPAELLDGYMAPLFDKAMAGEPGWAAYLKLVARIAGDERWAGLVERHFDGTARAYLAALRQAMPYADPVALAHAFSMVLPAMLATAAGQSRVERLSGGEVKAEDLAGAYAALLAFATAGLKSLEG